MAGVRWGGTAAREKCICWSLREKIRVSQNVGQIRVAVARVRAVTSGRALDHSDPDVTAVAKDRAVAARPVVVIETQVSALPADRAAASAQIQEHSAKERASHVGECITVHLVHYLEPHAA